MRGVASLAVLRARLHIVVADGGHIRDRRLGALVRIPTLAGRRIESAVPFPRLVISIISIKIQRREPLITQKASAGSTLPAMGRVQSVLDFG